MGRVANVEVGRPQRLVEDDLEGAIRQLKAERDGEIEVAGRALAQSNGPPLTAAKAAARETFLDG
jgi:hypothetical protein